MFFLRIGTVRFSVFGVDRGMRDLVRKQADTVFATVPFVGILRTVQHALLHWQIANVRLGPVNRAKRGKPGSSGTCQEETLPLARKAMMPPTGVAAVHYCGSGRWRSLCTPDVRRRQSVFRVKMPK